MRTQLGHLFVDVSSEEILTLGYMYSFQLSCLCDTRYDLREMSRVSASNLSHTPLPLEAVMYACSWWFALVQQNNIWFHLMLLVVSSCGCSRNSDLLGIT